MRNGNLRKFVALCFIFVLAIVFIGMLGASNSLRLDKNVIVAFAGGLSGCVVGIIWIVKEHCIPHKKPKTKNKTSWRDVSIR